MVGNVKDFEAAEYKKLKAINEVKKIQNKILKGRISLVQINKEM